MLNKQAKKIAKYSFMFFALSSLFISCSKDDEDNQHDVLIQRVIDEVNADSLQKYTQWLQDMGTRFMLANNRKTIALAIQKKFISFGFTDTRLDSFYNSATFHSTPYQTWQYNVIATITGKTSPNSISIMGGHYDDYSKNSDLYALVPGANDNASGIAATLEVARVINNSKVIPTGTIQFVAFAAEELGLFGSRDYAQKLSSSNSTVSMMLNCDMIGFWPNSSSEPWTVNIADYSNSSDLRISAQKITSIYTSLKTNNNNQYNKQSDSYPFFLYGFKAIFFESNANDMNYHTANDIESNCNFAYLKEVAKVSCALLIDGNKL